MGDYGGAIMNHRALLGVIIVCIGAFLQGFLVGTAEAGYLWSYLLIPVIVFGAHLVARETNE